MRCVICSEPVKSTGSRCEDCTVDGMVATRCAKESYETARQVQATFKDDVMGLTAFITKARRRMNGD